jgi:hypothetical protein
LRHSVDPPVASESTIFLASVTVVTLPESLRDRFPVGADN